VNELKNVVCPDNRILLGNKKEPNTDAGYDTDNL
jgi:hypothetical protein